MNDAILEVNSYTQSLRIFINGTQPSIYSELSNFTFAHALDKPRKILDAIAREVNDDFALLVTANDYEFYLIQLAAGECDYCTSCQRRAPTISLSTQERAAQMGQLVPIRNFLVYTPDVGAQLREAQYGGIRIAFTGERSLPTDFSAEKIPTPLVLSACETRLVNPLLGGAIAGAADCSNEIAALGQLEPILQAELPERMEVGATHNVSVRAVLAAHSIPEVSAKSSNPSVVAVDGMQISAKSAGSATVQLFRKGENQPFYSQVITTSTKVLAAQIELLGLDKNIHEGTIIELSAKVFPEDADDAGSIVYECSDPNIAAIRDGKLILLSSGSCEITAKAEKVSCTKKIFVQGKLASLTLSRKQLELNVGQRAAVSVVFCPSEAFNKEYRWESSDSSVAIVTEENGKEYIKSVGIGSCEITCRSADGTLTDTCAVQVNSIMYGNKKGASMFSRVVMAMLSVIAGLYLCFVLALGVMQLFKEVTPPQNIEQTVSQKTLDELILQAQEQVMGSAYIEDPYWSEIQWQPISSTYQGYFICQQRSSGPYYLFVVHEVELVNPESVASKKMYSTVRFESGENDDAFDDYILSSTDPSWHANLYEWIDSYTDNDIIHHTSFTNDELNEAFGWNSYVLSAAEISPEIVTQLIEKCIEAEGLEGYVAAIEDVRFYKYDNPYSESRNLVRVYLRRDNIDPATGAAVSYFYPFTINNLKLISDENGAAILDEACLVVQGYDYVLHLEDSPGYSPTDGIALPFDHINFTKYPTADMLSAEMFQDIVDRLIAEQTEEHQNEEYGDLFTYSEIQIAGIYFREKRPDGDAYHENELHIILTYDRFYCGELNFHMCTAMVFRNITLGAENSVNIRYENGEIESYYLTLEEYFANMDGDYRIAELE